MNPTASKRDVAREAELLGPAGGASLRLRFSGSFEGRSVIWDATFTTLAGLQAGNSEGRPLRRFIEIGEENAHGIPLNVGLDVPCIDIPTVRKAITMIRQYKRLARGRHEYGPVIPAPPS